MASPDDFYRPWEDRIDSWAGAQDAVNLLTERYPQQRLLWRGARDASWGVESSLFRHLKSASGGHAPTEEQMVAAESRIIHLARERWRFDGMGALETFARLQHLGGPTRLLDVSESPLVALWFATEQRLTVDETEARLFAFVTPERDVRLNANWGGRYPHWHARTNADDAARRRNKWGTGTGRRFWRPPAYDSRISAQSAGFLIDGVPIDVPRSEHAFGRRAPDQESWWSAEEMRDFGSIPLKLTHQRAGTLAPEAAPVFTFRISIDAKAEIRNQLEWRYGYGASSIYSDLFGLAQYLTERPDRWAAAHPHYSEGS